MDEPRRLEQRIADAVVQFQRRQMSVTPRDVTVDCRPTSVVVTIRGATCQAERECARRQEGREMVQKLYAEVYKAAKRPLEKTIGNILGVRVQHSRLSVDPQSGDAVLLLTLPEA